MGHSLKPQTIQFPIFITTSPKSYTCQKVIMNYERIRARLEIKGGSNEKPKGKEVISTVVIHRTRCSMMLGVQKGWGTLSGASVPGDGQNR